jgi:hypothetical protein
MNFCGASQQVFILCLAGTNNAFLLMFCLKLAASDIPVMFKLAVDDNRRGENTQF